MHPVRCLLIVKFQYPLPYERCFIDMQLNTNTVSGLMIIDFSKILPIV